MNLRNNKFLVFTFSFMTSPAMAASAPADRHAILVTSLLYLAYAISFVGGMLAIRSAISGFMNYQELSQREGGAAQKIIVRLMIAGVLLQPQTSIEVTLNTLGLSSGSQSNAYCFAYEPVFLNKFTETQNKSYAGTIQNSDIGKGGDPLKCYTQATTGFVQKLSAKLAESEKTTLEKIMSEQVRFLIGIIQAIGAFFYFNASFKIWSISDGTERQSSYKAQVLIILFSAAIVNLPETIQFIMGVIEYYSFNN